MKNKLHFMLSIGLSFWAISCHVFSTLHSNTTIKPNDSFILGNNPHGTVNIVLTNTSESLIKTEKHPIDGGNHTPSVIQKGESVRINLEKNTALHILNENTDPITVKLKVKGDLNLSMGYKNKD